MSILLLMSIFETTIHNGCKSSLISFNVLTFKRFHKSIQEYIYKKLPGCTYDKIVHGA